MCGIVGFVGNEENKDSIIRKMADRIEHRGPDGIGYYVDQDVAFGHRRLAIIDIDGGMQPMYNEAEDNVIIFNGEIYNYKELKSELSKKHIFKTNSDTEVILHGYEEWGVDILKKLRGMFAFAIWDKNKKQLFCARDPFGIKPFYYFSRGGGSSFIFGSEIKTFLEHPGFNKELNKDKLFDYLTYGFVPGNETFFKDVKALEPGCYLYYKDGKIEIERYYDISFEETKDSYLDVVEKIDKVMKETVEYHKISDVEVGAFLSSGIDSSYIVSLAKPNKTYTASYKEDNYSELNYARDLSEKLAIKNVNYDISKKEYMQVVKDIMYYMDEPIGDAAALSLYFIAKRASEDVKVILSGEGADEFFGGYNTYKEVVNFRIYNKIPFKIRHLMASLVKYLPEFRGRNFLVRRGTRLEDEYIGINRVFSDQEGRRVLASEIKINKEKTTKKIFQQFKDKDDLVKMQAVDIKNWLQKDILLKADKMTMANSLELRVPFLDKEVFGLASSLKREMKVTKENTKVALRDAAHKVIPNNSYGKKKLGFPVPLRFWMRSDDVYQEIKMTFSQNYVKEFFDQKYILRLLNKTLKGKGVTYKKVWTIYAFLKWYDIFFREEKANF